MIKYASKLCLIATRLSHTVRWVLGLAVLSHTLQWSKYSIVGNIVWPSCALLCLSWPPHQYFSERVDCPDWSETSLLLTRIFWAFTWIKHVNTYVAQSDKHLTRPLLTVLFPPDHIYHRNKHKHMDSGRVTESTAVREPTQTGGRVTVGNPPLLLLLISLSLYFSDMFTHTNSHLHSLVDQLTVTFWRTVDIPQPVGHNSRGFPSLVKVKKQMATKTEAPPAPF